MSSQTATAPDLPAKPSRGFGVVGTSILTAGALAAGWGLNAYLTTVPGVPLDAAQVGGLITQGALTTVAMHAAKVENSAAHLPPVLGLGAIALSAPYYSTFPIQGGWMEVIKEGAPISVPILGFIIIRRLLMSRRAPQP